MGEAHGHGPEKLCEAGRELYARALRERRLHSGDASQTPCLVGFGLLQPSVEDPNWLEPIAPAVVLHRLLRNAEDRIAYERRHEEQLAEAFEPLMRIEGSHTAVPDTLTIRVLRGKGQIDLAVAEALAKASEELLAIQPHNGLAAKTLGAALERDQALLDRGARIRTLYQHPVRHTPPVVARYELLRGDVEARTLDEVTERLLVIDRAVAFVAASKDRTIALEVRTPALLTFFVTTFDRLWRLATPMYPEAVHPPSLNGITPRQHAIAALLVEGHTDAAIADRLGLNIRTARVHIAKLAATLGSESRAQLGYLIGRSGILESRDRES
ncbi:helix-turn-helix transcriptional regulator [Streptomyces umbrinus]|uniref:helix-turn-helix transcriptional regulator n=1 Tax=Streptomyces umbrinus TaxID=67370 RepID=UPI00167B3FB6|nr:helix-turn-helix transcriptional regulator [Streptomyces umbrinus]